MLTIGFERDDRLFFVLPDRGVNAMPRQARDDRDLIAEVSKFREVFELVKEKGFFEEISIRSLGKMQEGKTRGLRIDLTGCVPSNPEYAAEGCEAFISTAAIFDTIVSCNAKIWHRQVKNVTVKITTSDWELRDPTHDHIIGSKGTRYDLHLYFSFRNET